MLNRSVVRLVLVASLVSSALTLFLERIATHKPAVALMAQPAPSMQAQQFELLDASGGPRGVLRMAPEGTGPGIALLDEAGRRRADMTQNSAGEYAFFVFDAASALHRH